MSGVRGGQHTGLEITSTGTGLQIDLFQIHSFISRAGIKTSKMIVLAQFSTTSETFLGSMPQYIWLCA